MRCKTLTQSIKPNISCRWGGWNS